MRKSAHTVANAATAFTVHDERLQAETNGAVHDIGSADVNAFQAAGGVYRKLFVEGSPPTPIYPKLLEAWKAEHAAKKET